MDNLDRIVSPNYLPTLQVCLYEESSIYDVTSFGHLKGEDFSFWNVLWRAGWAG